MKNDERLERQYIRLWRVFSSAPIFITIPELSEVLICTPRHARTLVNSMRDKGWLTWVCRSGRGVKGRLQCLYDEGRFASEARSSCTIESNFITPPPSTLYIKHHRPIIELKPSLHSGNAERHLMRMIHSGLARYEPGCTEPQPELAHRWQILDHGMVWRFYLRDGLVWHNLEAATTTQILRSISKFLEPQERRGIFSHVLSVSQIKVNCIEFTLTRPDYFFAHRLANPVYGLAHPEDQSIGLGPYKIGMRNNENLCIESFSEYHNVAPLLRSVEYNFSRDYIDSNWTDLSFTSNQLSKGQGVLEVSCPGGISFLAFNNRDKNLSITVRQSVKELLLSIVSDVKSRSNNFHAVPDKYFHSATGDALTEWEFPRLLSIAYLFTPENKLIVDELCRRLKFRKCILNVSAVELHSYFSTNAWRDKDICIGYFHPGDWEMVSIDWLYRSHPITKEMLSEGEWERGVTLLNIISRYSEISRFEARMRRLIKWAIESSTVTPLFSVRFSITYPSIAHGIDLFSQGWPDFRQIWFDI